LSIVERIGSKKSRKGKYFRFFCEIYLHFLLGGVIIDLIDKYDKDNQFFL